MVRSIAAYRLASRASASADATALASALAAESLRASPNAGLVRTT
jgi:hypothetical protein